MTQTQGKKRKAISRKEALRKPRCQTYWTDFKSANLNMFKELKEARSKNLKKSMKMIMTQFGVVINLLGGEVCDEVQGSFWNKY